MLTRFLKDETVVPFRDLWVAYFEKNHKEYIGLLETQCKGEFMKTMDLQSELRKAILHGFLKKIVVSYKTLSFSYLARELRISKESICHILLDMISEKKINGLIDEVEELYINQDSEGDKERGDQLRLLNKAVNYVLEVHQANMQ